VSNYFMSLKWNFLDKTFYVVYYLIF
jgi:hypothetical protein